MKLTVQDIYELADGLADLSDKELPTKTAFRIGRNKRTIADEVKTADELRRKIADKYKEKDTESGVKIKKDKREAFKKEFDELMAQEVEIKLSILTLHELGETTKGKTLANIYTIIKEDE